MENLKGINNLWQLDLALNTPDAALEEVAQFKSLGSLTITSSEQFTGTGLRHIGGLKQLQELQIQTSGVTDDSLASLRTLPNLSILQLESKDITDEGLKHLAELKKLERLFLPAGVTDRGLEHLKGNTALAMLYLNGTKVSDAGFELLAPHSKLIFVNVKNTQVTEVGVKKLAAALLQCKIEWDGGVIEPIEPAKK